MNTYKKYCPNVYIAQCTEPYHRGENITLTTRQGKEHECEVHNLVHKNENYWYYSITRTDGFNSQERAKRRLEKLGEWAENAEKRSLSSYEASNEGRDFLALAEPIKVGHHSEKRHRALIERNWKRMAKSVEESNKAKAYKDRMGYWEELSEKIDLSMPESIEFFEVQLEEAKMYHEDLKNGVVAREHSYSLTYAKKRVNDLQKKLNTAIKLWR